MKLRVKEFADFCNISVRALHLYDKIDLFHPCIIDGTNGYRYYNASQILELNTIISLKKVGFTLNEIKKLKEHGFSKQDIIESLENKILENRRQMEIASYNIKNLRQMLDVLGKRPEKPDDKQEALRISHLLCLENDKLEEEFSQILWL